MDCTTLEHWQNTTRFHTILTPLVMHMVMGQFRGAGYMKPVQLALDTQTALIEISNIGGYELLFDTFQTGLGLFNQLLVGGDDHRFGGCLSIEISQ